MGKQLLTVTGLTLGCLMAGPTWGVEEPDELMPGKVAIIKPNKLAKFVAKPIPPAEFDLPDSSNNPALSGASIRFFDTVSHPGSDFTFFAPPSPTKWKQLGKPPGSKGYKYKGDGTPSDPCTLFLIKKKVIKAVCKGPAVGFSLPFHGDLGVISHAGFDSKRYCVQFGGVRVGDGVQQFKSKDAGAPLACGSAVSPTPTVTRTFTPTPTATSTPTPTAIVPCGSSAPSCSGSCPLPFMPVCQPNGSGGCQCVEIIDPG